MARLGMKRVQPDGQFPVYRCEHATLVVTGPGRTRAAAATAFLGTEPGRTRAAIWVNVGIAGHAERHLGEVLLASRITDAASGRRWRPVLPLNQPCPAEEILTLDEPDMRYQHQGMVDMEASGFYPTACRCSSVERVQVLKVISDNRDYPAHTLRGKQVRRLMEESMEILEALLATLQRDADRRYEDRGYHIKSSGTL